MRGNVVWEQADVENVWVGQPLGAHHDGPTVTIIGGVHGDEPAGIQLVKDLRESLNLDDGTVYLIEGNPRAIEQGVRYTETNLNRCFRDEWTEEDLAEDPGLLSHYEVQRAESLLRYLSASQAALDVHNTTLAVPPENGAFMIAEVLDDPETMRTALAIGAAIISPGWSKSDKGGTDGWMFEHGKVGIGYESGRKADLRESLQRAHAATARFLIAQMLVDGDLPPLHTDPVFAITEQAPKRKSETLYWLAREFGNWEPLKDGELIAVDGPNIYRAKEGQLIVFPEPEAAVDDEAFILAHPVDPKITARLKA